MVNKSQNNQAPVIDCLEIRNWCKPVFQRHTEPVCGKIPGTGYGGVRALAPVISNSFLTPDRTTYYHPAMDGTQQKLRVKIWIECDTGDSIFGEGQMHILETIREQGSINAAAKALGMGYRSIIKSLCPAWSRRRLPSGLSRFHDLFQAAEPGIKNLPGLALFIAFWSTPGKTKV
jgi:hypothetical protein